MKVSDVVMAGVFEFMEHTREIGNLDERCWWASVHPDGLVESCTNSACHSGLQDRRHKGAAVLVNVIQTRFYEYTELSVQDHITPFLHWLLNTSPWSSAYITKDAEAAIEQGFILHRTDRRTDLVSGSCLAVRYTSEHAGLIPTWVDLVSAGFSKDLSFLLAHYLRFIGGTYRVGDRHINHCAVYPRQWNKTTVNNFLSHKQADVKVALRKTYKESPSLYGSSWIWGPACNQPKQPLSDWCQEIKYRMRNKGVKGLDHNPFPKRKRVGEQVDTVGRDALIKVLRGVVKDYTKNGRLI